MEKIGSIMQSNELCNKTLKEENEMLHKKINLLEKAIYEGHFDEVGDYVLNFQKEKVEVALGKIFGAKEVNIIH